MVRKFCGTAAAVGALCLIPLVSGVAQPVAIPERAAASADRNASPIRVQISVNFFMPGPANDGPESMALRDGARRTIYQMAAHECELLRDRLADDCKLENVTVNINRQAGQQVEGFQVGGTFGFRITQK